MCLSNKKGAALMQVLLVTVVLAGMSTMLLRAMLARSTSSRRTVRTVSAQTLIDSCMAEVNMLWSLKKPEYLARDLNDGFMYCATKPAAGLWHLGMTRPCDAAGRRYTYTCSPVYVDGVKFQVIAYIPTTSCPDGDEKCSTYAKVDEVTAQRNNQGGLKIMYEIETGSGNL